jgi:aminoglycoside phosphotransferase
MRYALCYTYVTTTRNCEDMLNQIRALHDHDMYDCSFKVTREDQGKEVVIYNNRKNFSKWKSNLYN